MCDSKDAYVACQFCITMFSIVILVRLQLSLSQDGISDRADCGTFVIILISISNTNNIRQHFMIVKLERVQY
jgi:hypothetical protein